MTKTFSANATDLIASFGNAAHHAIGAVSQRRRAPGRHAGAALERRLEGNRAEADAGNAQERDPRATGFQRLLRPGLALSADGAEVVVDTLVGAAVAAIERAAAFSRPAPRTRPEAAPPGGRMATGSTTTEETPWR